MLKFFGFLICLFILICTCIIAEYLNKEQIGAIIVNDCVAILAAGGIIWCWRKPKKIYRLKHSEKFTWLVVDGEDEAVFRGIKEECEEYIREKNL